MVVGDLAIRTAIDNHCADHYIRKNNVISIAIGYIVGKRSPRQTLRIAFVSHSAYRDAKSR